MAHSIDVQPGLLDLLLVGAGAALIGWSRLLVPWQMRRLQRRLKTREPPGGNGDAGFNEIMDHRSVRVLRLHIPVLVGAAACAYGVAAVFIPGLS